MDKDYANHLFKLECLRMAHREQLEDYGEIKNTKKVFLRAKKLYEIGKIEGFVEYQGIGPAPKPKKPAPPKKAQEGYIICPGCGEEVKATLTKHTFKKDGTKCGTTLQ